MELPQRITSIAALIIIFSSLEIPEHPHGCKNEIVPVPPGQLCNRRNCRQLCQNWVLEQVNLAACFIAEVICHEYHNCRCLICDFYQSNLPNGCHFGVFPQSSYNYGYPH